MLYSRLFFRFIVISLAWLGLSISPANASTYDWIGGELMGINGISVGGVQYDVKFIDGSASNIFYNEETSSNEFDFDYPNTLEPTQALLAAMPADVLINPWKLNGIGAPYFDNISQQWVSQATIYTTGTYPLPAPYNPDLIQGSSLSFSSVVGSSVFQSNISPNHLISYTFNLTQALGIVYADWTVASPVPVPAAIWLFGTALIGLVGFGRRKLAV